MPKKYIDADHLKVEIEKHIKEIKDAAEKFTPNMGFFDAKLSGIYDVMAILDSIQQEQPVEGLEEEIERICTEIEKQNPQHRGLKPSGIAKIAHHFYELGCRHVAVMYDDIEYKRQMVGELATKELVDEIVEEYKKYVDDDPVFSKHVNKVAGISIARHFAEWGKKKEQERQERMVKNYMEGLES